MYHQLYTLTGGRGGVRASCYTIIYITALEEGREGGKKEGREGKCICHANLTKALIKRKSAIFRDKQRWHLLSVTLIDALPRLGK